MDSGVEDMERDVAGGSGSAASSSNPYNRNPVGRNQHTLCPSRTDDRLLAAIVDYHHRGIADRKVISQLLWAEHEIKCSPATVTRRRADLGLSASGVTTKLMPSSTKRQLIMDQLSKDPNRRCGPRRVKEAIALDTGVHLTRDCIAAEMRTFDPEGFEIRHPTHKKESRAPLVAPGPHHEWSGNCHDKLASIGFPVYGFRDVWTIVWLGLWVVPDNRLKHAVAHLWLCLVHELGGIPTQTTTGCGNETTTVCDLGNALREALAPQSPTDEVPAHRFLRSVESIAIKHSGPAFRLEWGDNVKTFYERKIYKVDPANEKQWLLSRYVWSTTIQNDLDDVRYKYNNHKSRKDRTRTRPSGVSPAVAMSLYRDLGGQWGLQPVDRDVVENLMDELGGEDLIRFVPREYEARARDVMATLDIDVGSLKPETAWTVYDQMLPHM